MNFFKKSLTLKFAFAMALTVQALSAIVPTGTVRVEYVGHGCHGSWHAYDANNADLGVINRDDAVNFRDQQAATTTTTASATTTSTTTATATPP